MTNPNDFTRKKPGQKKKSQARNRLKLKTPPIKLFLKEHTDFRQAIRHALDNLYRWTPFNIHEINEYMTDIENKLNPVNPDLLASANVYTRPEIYMRHYQQGRLTPKEIYRDHKIEWNIPPCFFWLHRIIYLWEISRKSRLLKHENLTIKEWFAKVDLDFPQELELDSNILITTRKDLERTGIFEALDLKIKEVLGIEDKIEYAVHNWHELEPLEKDHIKILFATKAISKKHPYYILIKENIEQGFC